MDAINRYNEAHDALRYCFGTILQSADCPSELGSFISNMEVHSQSRVSR